MKAYGWVVLIMAACTALGTLILPLLSVTDVAMLYLLVVGLVASRFGRGPSAARWGASGSSAFAPAVPADFRELTVRQVLETFAGQAAIALEQSHAVQAEGAGGIATG